MRLPALWRQPAFRSLCLAGLVSDTGDWLLFIALPVVVYQLTGSALGTSLAFLVELAPGIVLAPLAGWCADRFDRRRVLIVVSGLQAAALVPLLVVHTRAGLPVIYAVILVEAVLFTVFDPVKNALLPRLVPGTEVVSANSLVGLSQNLARLAGGPLGGVLLAAGGLRVVVAADLISYLIAAVMIARIVIPPSIRPAEHHTGPRRPGRGAYRSMLRNRPIRAALLVTLISQIAQGIFVVLFILFVAQRLHGGSSDIGLLRGVQAVGAIASGVILAMIARRYSPGTLTAGRDRLRHRRSDALERVPAQHEHGALRAPVHRYRRPRDRARHWPDQRPADRPRRHQPRPGVRRIRADQQPRTSRRHARRRAARHTRRSPQHLEHSSRAVPPRRRHSCPVNERPPSPAMPPARSADTGTRDWMTGCGSSCGDKPDALTPSACPADVDAVQIPDVTSLMELVRLPVVSDLLERVWWVGGSPCSGKSTLAQAVAAGCGVALYSCDDAFEPHAASVAPANGPTLKKVTSLGVTERLSQPIDVQVADVFKLYREEWPLILTDLQALSGPVVVEGAALLPELLADLQVPSDRAVWVVPTERFQRDNYARRRWAQDLLRATADPAGAFDRWMQRDAQFAAQIADHARTLGYSVLVTDGSGSVQDVRVTVSTLLDLPRR